MPRRPDKSASTDFSIVWLAPTKAEALKASLQVQGQLGIVRAKHRYGLRVPAARFTEIFGTLKPGQIAPTKVQITAYYRIGPLPTGVGADELQKWAVKASWQVRVIKALGATHWLLGASGDPPSLYPSFNGKTVLITNVPPRSQQPSVLESGSFSGGLSQSSDKPGSATGSEAKADPWTIADPWANYKNSKSHAAPFAPPVTSAPAPRQCTGPTEKRLQAQEDRLKALEEGLHNLRVQGEERHNVLLKQQTDDRDAAKAQNEQLSDRIALLSHDFSRQLQQSVDSLQGAQAQQQKQVQTSIDELKQLLLAGREPATQSHAKKPRHEPQESQDDL